MKFPNELQVNYIEGAKTVSRLLCLLPLESTKSKGSTFLGCRGDSSKPGKVSQGPTAFGSAGAYNINFPPF